jgi:hypothetical protein
VRITDRSFDTVIKDLTVILTVGFVGSLIFDPGFS